MPCIHNVIIVLLTKVKVIIIANTCEARPLDVLHHSGNNTVSLSYNNLFCTVTVINPRRMRERGLQCVCVCVCVCEGSATTLKSRTLHSEILLEILKSDMKS